MNSITFELIFTTRQTMQRGFASCSDISRQCVNSSCAELSFVSFSMFTDIVEVCYAKYGDILNLYKSILIWTRSCYIYNYILNYQNQISSEKWHELCCVGCLYTWLYWISHVFIRWRIIQTDVYYIYKLLRLKWTSLPRKIEHSSFLKKLHLLRIFIMVLP